MKVYIACDHAGYEEKNILAEQLSKDYDVTDLGPKKLDLKDDYPLYAERVARAVVAQPGSMGILVCRSGQGMEIAANKVNGVRAALVWNKQLAAEARHDNDSNVHSLPAGEVTAEAMVGIAQAWLSTPFSKDDRHVRRIAEITQMEQE